MLTDLQKRKLSKMFRLLDGDGDGVLVRGDYDRTCRRLLAVLRAEPGSEDAAEIEASYATEWDELQAEADRARGGRVTLDGWLDYRGAQLEGPDAFETMIDPYVETVFAKLDRDGDRRISTEEVRGYLGLYRMPDEELDLILGRIDPDRRGIFSRQDIGQLARDYYLSDDPDAPGSWLLGRH
jgi:Ca2+-binding EF-hand superfamily protein